MHSRSELTSIGPMLFLSGLLAILGLIGVGAGDAQAQAGFLKATDPPPAEQVGELPEDLTPEMVDGLVATLTDSEIRALLLRELKRRADERAAAETVQVETLTSIRNRLTEMAATIETRVTRWIKALGDLGSRREKVAARLARAESGIGGMIAAALAVAAAGIAAAFATIWASAAWRRWLVAPQRGRYWDRVVRTISLGLLELAPIVAFVFVTVTVAPLVAGALGPMIDYVWIYHIGVSYSWGFIVIARRAFAFDAPAIRIAQLTDEAAGRIHKIVRRAVFIGAAGWLVAGLSPTLGLGFPPALVTVALAGTAVAAVLLTAAAGNRGRVREAMSGLLIEDGAEPGAFARIAVAAAPVVLIGYLTVAYLYWLAHWLERGQQRLDGPAGTLVFVLLIPILDRLGLELVRSVIRSSSPAAGRYRAVFHGAWRMLLGIATVFVIAGLWGLDIFALVKGDDAARWAGVVFDVSVTLLIGQLIWRLIRAALYREQRTATSGDPDELSEVVESSRLDTLIPLLRNVLLGILLAVVCVTVLASLGVDIGPLLASAGIIGIAVGFGAQTLVRDIFSGAFFLIDDAFRVGEYIELDKDLRGEVESISIRSLQLRHHLGPVVTIPFGELKSVTNHSRDWVIYKMKFRLEPETDPQLVKKVVKEVGKEFLAHPEHGPKFIEPLKSQGVYMIDDDSALVIRVKFKCKPRAQFVLRREIYHRLRVVFAEKGIRFARRKVEVIGPAGGGGANLGALPDDILMDPAPGKR